MKTRKALIIFDIDGTLTDSVQQHQSAFVSALRRMGVQQINTDFKAYKHHTDSHIAKTIYELDRQIAFGPEQLNHFEQELHTQLRGSSIREISGALRMINTLEQERDFGICFATGSLHKPAVYKLEQTGIVFDPGQLAASNNIEDRETIVLTAIEQAKTYYGQSNFDHMLSIGDGLWDLRTAQKLGLEFMGIGKVHKETLLEYGMQHHFDDWSTFEPSHFHTAINTANSI